MNIYQKISEVMKDVQYLSKDDHIQFKTTNYKAISEEKVTSVVRESLIKHGIVIIPIGQEHKREGNLSTVDVSYKIQNVDDPEDFVIAMSSGTGADTQDKGVGKAMTYAYKYLLLRTFAIPTGEDPDKIPSAKLDDEEKKKKANEEKKKKAQKKSNKPKAGPDPNIQLRIDFLENLIKSTGSDRQAFLKYQKVPNIESLCYDNNQFNRAVDSLNKKQEKMKGAEK